MEVLLVPMLSLHQKERKDCLCKIMTWRCVQPTTLFASCCNASKALAYNGLPSWLYAENLKGTVEEGFLFPLKVNGNPLLVFLQYTMNATKALQISAHISLEMGILSSVKVISITLQIRTLLASITQRCAESLSIGGWGRFDRLTNYCY